LIETLQRSREQGRLKRRLAWLRKPHVLVIDEVGYESLSREQANLLFQVVNIRYEHNPIIITTNNRSGNGLKSSLTKPSLQQPSTACFITLTSSV